MFYTTRISEMIHFYEFNFYFYPFSISTVSSLSLFFKQTNRKQSNPRPKFEKFETNHKYEKKNKSNEYFLKNCKFSINGEEGERERERKIPNDPTTKREPHVLRAGVSDTGKYSLSSLIRNSRSVNRLSPMIT